MSRLVHPDPTHPARLDLSHHFALLARIRPGALADDVMDHVAREMSAIIIKTPFATPAHERAAGVALDFRGRLSYPVGMSVHDVGDYRARPLEVGTAISVDPILWLEEERSYVRCKDTIVVTEDGCMY